MVTPGVILATGGFGANVAFRQKVNTGVWKHVRLDDTIGCTNIQKAAQGDGLFMAQKAGAELIGLSDIQLHPWRHAGYRADGEHSYVRTQSDLC